MANALLLPLTHPQYEVQCLAYTTVDFWLQQLTSGLPVSTSVTRDYSRVTLVLTGKPEVNCYKQKSTVVYAKHSPLDLRVL